MDLDDLIPKRPGDPLAEVVRQDIDRLSNDELAERITALEGEIARCKARMNAAVNHRANAETLFKR